MKQENPAKYEEMIKRHTRKAKENARRFEVATTNGKIIKGIKRDRPKDELCELYGFKPKRLNYHHYDDNDLLKGMWVCGECHWAVEKFEKENFFKRYVDLCRQINVLPFGGNHF